MFQDERIDIECGKIYQRGILYATLFSLLYGVLYTIRLIAGGDSPFPALLNVFFIVLCGAVILIIGAVQYPHGDERCEYERHRYYFRAGKAFIFGSLAGYGFAIPFAGHTSNGLPINYIFFLLEALGCIYFFYAFKSRGLFFNYSIIDRTGREYYRAVLGNIGRSSAVIMGVFSLAAVLELGWHRSFSGFFGILVAGILSALTFTLYYFLISWAEKLSYDGMEGTRLARGTIVAFGILLVLTLSREAIGIAMAVILEKGLQASAGMMGFLAAGAMLSSLTYDQLCVGLLVSAASAMLLGGLLWQNGGKKTRRCIQWLLGFSAFGIVFNTASEAVSDIVALLGVGDQVDMMRRMTTVMQGIAVPIALVADVLGIWLLVVLVREHGVKKRILAAPVLGIAMALIDLYLTSQDMHLVSAIANTVVSLACIGIVLATLCTHKFSPIFREDGDE